MKKRSKILSTIVILAVLIGGYFGVKFLLKVKRWKNLDSTYSEAFQSPKQVAPSVKGKKVLFHIKTGLDQDDSQICVGFNIIFAAIEAGGDVTILFDSGATLDLTEKRHNLLSTGVPLRLKKVIAAQMNLPLDEMPSNYGEYLALLNKKGAKVYANTAMNVVTGYSDKVLKKYKNYSYIEPVTYAGIVEHISKADVVISY